MKLRKALFAADKKNAKKYPEYAEMESDLDDEWIDNYQITLYELEKEKITKKFEKENKKLLDTGETVLTPAELVTRLKVAEEFKANLKLEYDDDWRATNLTEAKILTAIEKIDVRITTQKIALTDKDEGKEVSLGTSKMNYLDPRIT